MSSVTMSTTVPAPVREAAPDSRTSTAARPCGRLSPSAAFQAATAATRRGPAVDQIVGRDQPVVRAKEAGQVTHHPAGVPGRPDRAVLIRP